MVVEFMAHLPRLKLLRISKASSKLLKLTFGRFIFYKAVYALTKEGKLNLFRYHFTTKLYHCPKKCSAEGIVSLMTRFVESLACFHSVTGASCRKFMFPVPVLPLECKDLKRCVVLALSDISKAMTLLPAPGNALHSAPGTPSVTELHGSLSPQTKVKGVAPRSYRAASAAEQLQTSRASLPQQRNTSREVGVITGTALLLTELTREKINSQATAVWKKGLLKGKLQSNRCYLIKMLPTCNTLTSTLLLFNTPQSELKCNSSISPVSLPRWVTAITYSDVCFGHLPPLSLLAICRHTLEIKAWDRAAPGRFSRRALPDQAEGFQELVEVNVPILVEVNAANQVVNAIIREFNVHVGAEQFPGLLEFLKGDETCRGAFNVLQLHLLMWRTLTKTQLRAAEA
ncbi:hypothetical protein EK904_002076 [Melospiza melodia maxima]|nr:hypothetical protein EK904_002076 [Melospiza melodia maxima]